MAERHLALDDGSDIFDFNRFRRIFNFGYNLNPDRTPNTPVRCFFEEYGLEMQRGDIVLDIMLDKDGDIKVSEHGDIFTTESIRQAVLIRLRWIYNEWRLGPEFGFPWFEEVFVKNPNIAKIRQSIKSEIMKVDGVTSVTITKADFNRSDRSATFEYVCTVGEEFFREEVTLYG